MKRTFSSCASWSTTLRRCSRRSRRGTRQRRGSCSCTSAFVFRPDRCGFRKCASTFRRRVRRPSLVSTASPWIPHRRDSLLYFPPIDVFSRSPVPFRQSDFLGKSGQDTQSTRTGASKNYTKDFVRTSSPPGLHRLGLQRSKIQNL